MIWAKTLLIIIEIVCCLLLICIILLQKSKSEGLGLAFGAGAGESLFGARAGNVLSKATVVLGIIFMATTLLLGVLFAQQEKGLMDDVVVPVAESAVLPEQQLFDAEDLKVSDVAGSEETTDVATDAKEEM
jgi:preprotein translocase subunit SecG